MAHEWSRQFFLLMAQVKGFCCHCCYIGIISSTGLIDLFRLGGLLPHFRPVDDTLENSSFQIFNIFRGIKEKLSGEFQELCNATTNRPSKKGLLLFRIMVVAQKVITRIINIPVIAIS